ncbi:hypothetical protein G9A89_023537 [Geosiphon pyriformis]|nr:hypothetical protein G9A89_023537 [Geosiphon pyriformis]
MGTTAHDLWNFIDSIDGKTYFIDCNLSNYSRACCTSVCFGSELDLVNIMAVTLVIKSVGLCWSRLFLASCVVCKNFGYTFLSCRLVKDAAVPNGRRTVLSAQNQLRLVRIYAKKSASIFRPLAFGGKTWASVVGAFSAPPFSGSKSQFGSIINGEPLPPIVDMLEERLVSIESSLVSLMGQIGELAKRLDSLVLAVSQPSSGCQLPVTPSSQNLESNIVMGVASNKTTSDETAAIVDSSVSFQVTRLENMLKRLSKSVLSLSAYFESSVLAGGVISQLGMTNPAKQNNIICWHNDMNNLISIFTETKLKERVCPWIINKFDGIRVFTSGLDSGYLGAGVVIVVNSSLARHVCKVSEVLGWLLSIKLLFKNKLLVLILGLYAGASSVAVNESSFVIFGGDFNENGLYKSTSFKKCFNLGLVNFLLGSSVAKSVKKTIDYMFVSSSLVSVIIHHDVLEVGKHYNMDHQAVSVSIGLSGLLDAQLNSLRKQANKDCWKFDFKGANGVRWNNFKDATLANAMMFSDEFTISTWFLDLDAMWNIVRKILVLSASKVFKKKWFKGFNNVFTKEPLRFHKLELLVSKIVKALCEECVANFESLMRCWVSLDNVRALVVQSLVDSGAGANDVHSAFFGARRSYRASKLAEFLRAKETNIRSAIDKRMENFEMVLDHLVISNKLILKPNLVKSKTRKWVVVDDAFSEVICVIDFDELYHVVSNLSNGKAAGLLSISNKLWKHYNKSVLGLLLVLLNSCLSRESILGSWREAWENVLMNTYPIALIETAHKILFKILSDRISLACSSYNVLCGDNFSVLKGMATQSPIFAIGSVVEDALEKNRELWLVLQDMQKAYDSIGWEHLKKSLVRIKMKRLDPRGPVSEWFERSVKFLVASYSSLSVLVGVSPVNICGSNKFVSVCDHLSQVDADSLSVYIDESLKNLGMTGCKAGAAAFFKDINLGLGISVQGLVSSTLAELQIIALALECVPVACSVCLFLDSQTALDACMSEIDLMYSDFYNWCWVEHQHIRNVIRSKNLRVSWHKVKADSITNAATLYNWFFPSCVDEHFLLADNGIVSGNSRHFVRNVFVLFVGHVGRIWHSDSHMATDFTSRNNIWLVHVKHHAYMKKNGLILVDGSIPVSVSGLVSRFLGGVVKLLGIGDLVFVNIDV